MTEMTAAEGKSPWGLIFILSFLVVLGGFYLFFDSKGVVDSQFWIGSFFALVGMVGILRSDRDEEPYVAILIFIIGISLIVFKPLILYFGAE